MRGDTLHQLGIGGGLLVVREKSLLSADYGLQNGDRIGDGQVLRIRERV